MKYAVISDICGNALALTAVLEDARSRGADDIINLGDIVSGPLWPWATLDIFKERSISSVCGDQDRLVVEGKGESDDRYAREDLPTDRVAYLESIPRLLYRNGVVAFHGRPKNDKKSLLENAVGGRLIIASSREIVGRIHEISGAIIFCGHSRLPSALRAGDGRWIINPGSVGCPAHCDIQARYISESGSPFARYAIVDVDREDKLKNVDLISVDYNYSEAAARAEELGRPEWAHALRTGRMPVNFLSQELGRVGAFDKDHGAGEADER